MRGSTGPIPARRRMKTQSILLLPLQDSCRLVSAPYGSCKEGMLGDAHSGRRAHLSAAALDFSGSLRLMLFLFLLPSAQRSAHELPMVESQDVDSCLVYGGQQMILTGQNFTAESKVVFMEKTTGQWPPHVLSVL